MAGGLARTDGVSMGALVDRVRHFMDETPAIGGAAIDVALSGGKDSVVLAAIIQTLAPRFGWQVRLHHIRHAWRDDSADAQVASAVATALALPLLVTSLPPPQDLAGDGPEATARQARYHALRDAAEQRGAPFIVTGHHGDDNIETLLWRLLRGCGLEGLAAIPPRQRLGPRVALLRPLLGAGRSDVEAFLDSSALPWLEDPTNRDEQHVRNALRHQVIPHLRRLCPRQDLAKAYASLLLVRQDVSAFQRLIAAQLQQVHFTDERAAYLPSCLLEEAPEVVAQLVRHTARRVVAAFCPTQRSVRSALESFAKGGRAAWRDEALLYRREGPYAVLRALDAQPPVAPTSLMPVAAASLTHWEDLVLLQEQFIPLSPPTRRRSTLWLDAAALRGALTLRPLGQVEGFVPVAGATANLGKITAAMGIPPPWRAVHPVLCDDAGPLWILGGPRSERAQPPRLGVAALRVELVTLPWYLAKGRDPDLPRPARTRERPS